MSDPNKAKNFVTLHPGMPHLEKGMKDKTRRFGPSLGPVKLPPCQGRTIPRVNIGKSPLGPAGIAGPVRSRNYRELTGLWFNPGSCSRPASFASHWGTQLGTNEGSGGVGRGLRPQLADPCLAL